MSPPSNRIVPASDASRPDIWLISVVLPAPFGPMTACSSPCMTSSVTSSVTTSAPNFFRSPSRRSIGSTTAEPPRHLGPQPDQPAAGEQDDDHQHRPEDHLPVLGEAGEPLLRQQIGRGAEDGAV